TLCGGHISPILVGAKARGIDVIDVRHEANAVFAADAVARLTGVPGVAAVTAGPGLTNTITAVKNAQLAQSPVVIFGGATATILRGRGALQDIDQMALMRPHVKWATRVDRVRDIVSTVERAFQVAQAGIPGPVFVEVPVDILYDRELVKGFYGAKGKPGRKLTLQERALGSFLDFHSWRLFIGADRQELDEPPVIAIPEPSPQALRKAAKRLANAERPVLVCGSQTLVVPEQADAVAEAIEALGVPVFLSGMARGLLGVDHELQMRHGRRNALRHSDLVILAGVPADFRLEYGLHIPGRATYIAANRSRDELYRNRRPDVAAHCDAGRFLRQLARLCPSEGRYGAWIDRLRAANNDREAEIAAKAEPAPELINPIDLCRRMDKVLDPDSVLVADGGDFVATAAYTMSPRGPLRWLDPGVFGTLGVGGGFALGAKLARPSAETWILYGDGSVGYTLAEFDTFARHGLPVIAVVGNDACWSQIARDQIELLGDDVGCPLARTDYHRAAEGFGGVGLVIDSSDQIDSVLAQAKEAAADGKPVLVNVHLATSDFRKGSISM
ncbi:MAG: thiamine pyrophosphate-binding protein, partial [Myxococcales bacterium]|nr:thiamine pyrophosphate-binding protein [Myxococcales bacterium]